MIRQFIPKGYLAFAIGLLFCFVYNEIITAQEALDLGEALRLAKENNLRLQQQKAAQRIARLEELIRRSQRLPTVNFSVNSSYFSEVNEIDLSQTIGLPGRRVELGGHDRSEVLLSLRQPIFTGFRLNSQVELAKTASLNEQSKFDVLANEVYHQIHLLFYQAQSNYKHKKILKASLQRLNIQLEHVRNLFGAAQVMAFDTLQVYNQTLAVQLELQDALLTEKLVNLKMARILNLRTVRPIAETELARPSIEAVDLSQLKSEAVLKRPELRGVHLAQKATVMQRKLAQSTYYPAIFAHANFHYAKPGLDPVQNRWMDYFSVGVNVQWNLWRWRGDRKKVQQSEVQLNRLSFQEEELVQTIDYEVEDRYENLRFSLQRLRLAEELQAQETERYRVISVQHQNGIASTNDLITAETDLTKAELKTRIALINYYVFLADLGKAVGKIDETF